jgi:hypothetical protein
MCRRYKGATRQPSILGVGEIFLQIVQASPNFHADIFQSPISSGDICIMYVSVVVGKVTFLSN